MKPEEIGQDEDTEMLDASETKRFRSSAATLNYTSSDRSNVQYAAKEACTKMANPTRGSWKRLNKAGRYLKGVERVTWKMGAWQNDEEVNVDVHVDSNWASGPERKSTKRRNDDNQRHGRDTLVQNACDVCVEHGISRVLRSRHGYSGGTWGAVDAGRLGRDHPSASWTDSTLPKR